MKLPENVEYILEKLEKNGYRADIVGGPVRDFLLGKTPGDYDITTSASPEETKRIFTDTRTVDTGIKHGTVSIILDGEQYEVTTYRIDGEYKDSRHPESVTFTENIEEDLRRRDFTMNAIAYSHRHGITDPYGGIKDTECGIIRAVGEPKLRFTEDALRILRGARFSATLGFTVEEETKRAMLETYDLLDNVSVERIYVELRKMISGDFAYSALLDFSKIVLHVVPELSSLSLPDKSLFEDADYPSRLISLFYLNSDCPKEKFSLAMKRLHTDSRIRELGEKILPLVNAAETDNDRGLTRLLRAVGEECAIALVELRVLLGLSDLREKNRLFALVDKGVTYKISDLKINGKTLLALNAVGRAVGEVLSLLLDYVIDGKIENTEDALLDAAKDILSSMSNE